MCKSYGPKTETHRRVKLDQLALKGGKNSYVASRAWHAISSFMNSTKSIGIQENCFRVWKYLSIFSLNKYDFFLQDSFITGAISCHIYMDCICPYFGAWRQTQGNYVI